MFNCILGLACTIVRWAVLIYLFGHLSLIFILSILISIYIVINFSLLTEDGEVEGLIDDAPIEDEASEAEDSDADIGKTRKKRSVEDDQLEEDDFDLIEENLGIKVISSAT